MRVSIVALVQTSAPQRPACFADDFIWHQWLVSAHQSGLRVVRRADARPNAAYRAPESAYGSTHYELLPTRQIPYCVGCLWQHQRRMDAQGRCQPCEVQTEDADAA